MPPNTIAEWNDKAIGVPMAFAGVVFLLTLPLSIQMLRPAEAWPVDSDLRDLAVFPFLLIPASAVGALLSAIPLLIGVPTMVWAGTRNIGMRHPFAWALAGGSMAGGFVSCFEWLDEELIVLASIWTGAACALLSRRYVRWTEPEY
jgi:hypothetical protein